MDEPHPNVDLIALGIRQPWAELILRGIKTVEVRSQGTQIRGPIYLYASKQWADDPAARAATAAHGLEADQCPRGVLVGTVEIVAVDRATPDDTTAACVPVERLVDQFVWRLRHPQRLAQPLAVRFLPYGVWFYPFKRRR